MQAHTHARSELRELLTSGHRRLEQAFETLLSREKMDDPERIRDAWDKLERELQTHLRSEEELMLPVFELEAAAEAAKLHTEHHQIRSQLDQLGIDLDLHALEPVRVQQFIGLLRDHAAREERTLYPWAEAHLAQPAHSALTERLQKAYHELVSH